MYKICVVPFLLTVLCVKGQSDFEVPDALIEVMSPRGIRISIPALDGIVLFAIHAGVNQEFYGLEAGTLINVDVTKKKNGRFTYFNGNIKLKQGDVLNYWLYCDYNDGTRTLGYRKEDQTYVVKDLGTGTSSSVTTASPPPPPPVTIPQRPVSNNCLTQFNRETVCGGKEIFSEEFSDNKINGNSWNLAKKFAGAPDYEFVIYGDYPKALKVEDGRLKIKPIPTEEFYGPGFVLHRDSLDLGSECTGVPSSADCVQRFNKRFIVPPVLSAQISTKNKFSFLYGKVDIRAKLPKGNWIYPELYLNSEQESYGAGYESGQIRIAFLSGNAELSKNLVGGIVLGSSPQIKNLYLKNIEKTSEWSNEFHTYSVVWEPDHVTVSVDGKVYGNIFAPSGGFASHANIPLVEYANRWQGGSNFKPFDKEMYLTIGVGVGGYNFDDGVYTKKPWLTGEALSQKKFYRKLNETLRTWGDESLLEVDYIKVYSL